MWCHRYTRWPHHHEVAVLSQDAAHHVRSLWYQNYDITIVRFVWGHSDTSWAHHHDVTWCHRYTKWLRHHEVTVSSQCDVTDTWDDHIIMRSQCCHRTMLTMWDHYDIKIMTSPLWDLCEVTVIQVERITMMSQYCDNMMSQIHKMTTSPWGHSVVTMWCHRYIRWPHHHEVTVLSQDDAHHVRSLWYQNYAITSVRFLWDHSDRSWAHHLEVTVLSQYDVTGTQGDHITMRSQCYHMTMLTLWGHYDELMISKLWHHMCEMFVTSQWQMFMT